MEERTVSTATWAAKGGRGLAACCAPCCAQLAPHPLQDGAPSAAKVYSKQPYFGIYRLWATFERLDVQGPGVAETDLVSEAWHLTWPAAPIPRCPSAVFTDKAISAVF